MGCRATNISSAFSKPPTFSPNSRTRASHEGERTVPGQMALQRTPLAT